MSAAKLNWQETGQKLLQDLIKRVKAPKASVFVLSSSGDLIWQAGKSSSIDATSLGALVSGIRGIASELNQITKIKTDRVSFESDKNLYWVENLTDWMIVGICFEPNKKALDVLKKHLKKRSSQSPQKGNEAFDDLSSAAIETAVES